MSVRVPFSLPAPTCLYSMTYITVGLRQKLSQNKFKIGAVISPEATILAPLDLLLWFRKKRSIREVMARPIAYSYARFSIPEQERGDSERRQIEAARQYAEQQGSV
jgi:hypothetical protein